MAMIKICAKCKEEKDFSCFSPDRGKKASKDGLRSRCKKCRAEDNVAWHNKNKIRSLENSRKWKRENSDLVKQYSKKWMFDNPEKHALNSKIWKQNNKASNCNIAARYRSAKLQSTPHWLTSIHNAQIQEFYDIAAAKSFQTGIKYHVDHIHPLQGEYFNGLHVPWNLQIITAIENISKKNRMPESLI
jgi:hypothetical protein